MRKSLEGQLEFDFEYVKPKEPQKIFLETSEDIFIYLSYALFKTEDIAKITNKTTDEVWKHIRNLPVRKRRESYKNIDGAWFSSLMSKAQDRKLAFEIDMVFLNDLLEKQNFKCKLSGLPIKMCVGMSKNQWKELNTASLDRIDSSIGYVYDNVQWTYKEINMMKQSYSQERFIELCKNVAEHNK